MAEYGSMSNDDIKKTLSSYSGIGSIASSMPKLNKTKTIKPTLGASTTYSRPSYNVLSIQDALSQARSQLDPMKDLSVERVQESYDQEKKKLPQYLNARGQVFGGARVIGEKNLFNDESRQINDINTQNDAQVSSVAQQLMQRSQDRADTQSAQDFNQWSTIQNMLDNRYGNELAQYNTDRAFNYGTGRDATTDQRYADETTYNRSQNDSSRADQQALNAYNQALQRAELMGYITNDADASILGIPKGTPTSDAAYKSASLAATLLKRSSSGRNDSSNNGNVTVSNPFSNSSTPSSQQYTAERLDNYITSLKNRLNTPSAVLTYVQQTKNLAPGFRQSVLDRLNNYWLTSN